MSKLIKLSQIEGSDEIISKLNAAKALIEQANIKTQEANEKLT